MYVRPIPLTDPSQTMTGQRLAGGWVRFREVEVLSRGAKSEIVPLSDLPADVQARLTEARPALSGLTMDRPRLMGILNVTPDSFSDGGHHSDVSAALKRAHGMIEEGADLIDVGGESTRPGAAEVPSNVEIARIRPVIEGLTRARPDIPISLDTRKSAVARAGLTAGAALLNDVSGLRFDPALADVAATDGIPLFLMHSIGTPETMQTLASEGAYQDVLLDVFDMLDDAIAKAQGAGVPRSSIVVDPGIGFGKTDAENRTLLARIGVLHGLGCPILLGASRKGFVGRLGDVANASDRGPGSTALALWAVSQGVQLLRVHDIEMHRQAIALWRAVSNKS